MPKEIFNEGRVVGLSAYETYVKQALSTSPNIPVATEREWLSSTIANGTSMLLKVSPTTNSYEDYELPTTSRLVATNTIIASFMYGVEATFNGNWATQITNYGKIANAPSSASTVTSLTNTTYTDAQIKAIQKKQMQYIKIADGVVYQKGKWKSSGVSSPKTIPDKTSMVEGNAKVRLLFSDSINDEFYVLLTGFVDLQVAQGTTGLDSSVNTNAPQNGDFLGPATFPWMSKIWIATPGNLSYALKNGLSNGGKKNVVIASDPDSVITTIEVLNNIHTDKSGNFLKITQTLDGGDTNIDIDGSALIDDILAPGIGTNLVDASNNPKNSFGTAKKVVKSNLNAPNGSGITIDPLSSRDNKQGAVTQDIKTNIVAGKGVQITDDSSSTKRTIYSNVEPGKGITISPKSSTTSGTQTYTLNTKAGVGITIDDVDSSSSETTGGQRRIRTNITPGDGIQFNRASVSDNTNDGKAQEISTRLVSGNGTSVNTKDTAEAGIKGKSQKIDINVGNSLKVDSSNNLITNLKQGTGIAVNNSEGSIRTNIKAGTGIDVTPISSDDNSGAQTIKNQISGGQGINIKSITPKVSTTEITNGGTENPTINGSVVDMSSIAYGSYYTVNYEDKRFRWNGSKWVSDGNSTAGNTNIVTTNIKAGDGISVEAINGVVQITNTSPYVNSSNFQNVYDYDVPSGETQDVDAGIRIRYMNNWYCGCSDVSVPSGSSNNDIYNLTRIGNISTNPNDYPYVPSTNFVPFQIKMLPQWKINNNAATLSGMDVYIQSRKSTRNNSGRVSTFMPMCKNLAQVTRNGGAGTTEAELKSLREVNYEQYQFRIEAFWRSVVCGFDFTNAKHEFKHESTGNIVKLKDIDFSGSINAINEGINFHQHTEITLPVNNEYVLQRDGGLIIYDNSTDSYYKFTVGDIILGNTRNLTAYKISVPSNTWTASTTNSWMTTRMYNVGALSKYLYLKDPTNENSEYWNDSIKSIIQNCQFIIAITSTQNVTSTIDFTSDLKIYYPVLSNVGKGTYIPTTNKIAPDTPSDGVLTEGANRNRTLTDIGSMVTQFNYNSTFSSAARS